MYKLRAVQKLLIAAVFVIFIASAITIYVASKSIEVALLLSMFNILGSNLPPSEALVDAPVFPVFFAQAIDIAGNIVVTILLTTFLYQLLSKIDVHKRIMLGRARRMRNHSIIVRKNSIAMELAKKLEESGLQFVIIEKDPGEAAQAEKRGYTVITGDPAESSVLAEAGAERAHAIFLLGEEDVKNTLIAMTAKKLGRRIRIAARIKRISDIPKMERVGISHLVLPEFSVGNEIGAFMLKAAK